MSPTPIKHYLQFSDLGPEEYEYLLDRARILKVKFKNYETWHPLHDRTLAMIFEKSSTRTRLSFEAGIHQLGGHAVFLNTRDSQLGRGEPIEDAAQVISRMVDIIMIRTFGQEILERFAAHSRVPVISGLTTDTIRARCWPISSPTSRAARRALPARPWRGSAMPTTAAYTWIQAAERLGFTFHFSAPPGYQLDPAMVPGHATHLVKVFDNPLDACQGAHLVTTDVWTSMGFEAENDVRKRAFQDWMVTTAMMDRATDDALFMHCLPAHRGEEVEAAVIDGPRSVVWEEAENRLHVQRALMEYLLCGRY